MSTLELENIKHPDNSGNNIALASDGSISKIHVKSGDAGVVSASPQADDLVVEASTEVGITLISPDDQSARIRFTSPSTDAGDVGGATIFYRQNINKMAIGTEVAGGQLALKSGYGAENLKIDGSGRVTTPNQPYFMVYRNAGNYNVGAGQTVSIIYDTARYNIGGHFNNSNYRFTAPIDGLYNFSASVNHYNLPAGTRLRIQLHLNGQLTLMGGYIRTYDTGDHNVVFNSSLKLNANDYVEMKRYSDGASTAGTSSGQLWNWFSGYLIG